MNLRNLTCSSLKSCSSNGEDINNKGKVFLLLFLFAKRQIMRFALKSARKPHVNIGSDVPKVLRNKIHQCLEKTKNIYYEPTLLSEQVQHVAASKLKGKQCPSSAENHYHYRMKALDAFSNAVTTLQWSDSSVPHRSARQTIQLYLYCLCPAAAGTKDANIIERFARSYLNARHSPSIFGETEFIRYMELLDKVIRLVKLDQKRRNKSVKTIDLEVQMKGSQKIETVVYSGKSDSIPLEEIRPQGRRVGQEAAEQLTHRDISSGYSSTDRSNSDQGSSERLISLHEKKT